MEAETTNQQTSLASSYNWDAVKMGVFAAFCSLRCPEHLRKIKKEMLKIAAHKDPISVYKVMAVEEYERRNIGPAARDPVLIALTEELVAGWKAKAESEEENQRKEKGDVVPDATALTEGEIVPASASLSS
ncbi:hypothetical protein QKT49_gp438 [Acanthamoeba castellanii medusavirus]|uniref:Uncharacterized protein n=1 Tax=Acanthamoeba castellanii medusavirus J1 TaxID=3114988 RepID=A0A3T1CWZ2_9VIRU|nr:hypothetical protein QKT49_gp438 [Acanthamoeba castellanii medusavirus]BBI30325.1 hypothetical protein [Acanthamoeba castellanii medusavirus J1]